MTERTGDRDLEQENRLVQSAQGGDLEALGMLYDANVNKVYRYTLFRLRNRDDAADVTADVFLNMLKGLPTYKSQGFRFSVWLMKIARNETVNFFRKNKRETLREELNEDLPDTSNLNPEQSQEMKEKFARLYHAISTLPETQREVLILRFSSGLSFGEIAAVLGKKTNSVRMTQSKAIHRLQILMWPDLQEY